MYFPQPFHIALAVAALDASASIVRAEMRTPVSGVEEYIACYRDFWAIVQDSIVLFPNNRIFHQVPKLLTRRAVCLSRSFGWCSSDMVIQRRRALVEAPSVPRVIEPELLEVEVMAEFMAEGTEKCFQTT